MFAALLCRKQRSTVLSCATAQREVVHKVVKAGSLQQTVTKRNQGKRSHAVWAHNAAPGGNAWYARPGRAPIPQPTTPSPH